jgi:hypothetical protein
VTSAPGELNRGWFAPRGRWFGGTIWRWSRECRKFVECVDRIDREFENSAKKEKKKEGKKKEMRCCQVGGWRGGGKEAEMKWQPSLERESHYNFRLALSNSPFTFSLSFFYFVHFPLWSTWILRPDQNVRAALLPMSTVHGPIGSSQPLGIFQFTTDDPWDYLWIICGVQTMPLQLP